MSLTEACVKKPVFAWMLMLATVLFGGLAAWRLGISQFPDVDFPTISVSVAWEGAAPEVMEADVTEVLEEALVQVEGIKSITSTSQQGSAQLVVELDLARSVDLAMQDVQAAVSRAQRRLPEEIDAPVISKSNPEDNPILWIGLAGPLPPQTLADYARYRVRGRLQTVPGVGEITLGGYLERNVRVWVDAEKLDRYGLTVSELIGALQREHVELPAGRIETEGREINVRVLGEALDLETLRKITVREVGGAPVRVEDVALIEDGFEDARKLARVNGLPAQGMGIRKQRGSNAVAVARAVRAELDEIRKTLPADTTLEINFDSTRFIEESVAEIEFEIILAIFLTALVCWLFLGSLSSTLNVVLAIPMSLMGTMAVIHFLGFTLNTFTLLGLALAVGIVVDDAIMVMENIYRHAEGGKDRVRAALEGTAEITFAALAATVAIVAIFLPIAFMRGLTGRYLLQFGVTLSVAVMLSYLEAITLAPARCSQLLAASREGRSRVGLVADRAFDALSRVYARLLERALRHPMLVLGGALLLLIAAGLVAVRIPTELVPSQDQSRIVLRLQTAVGSNLEESDRLFRRAEAFLSGLPETQTIFTNVGSRHGSGSVNNAQIFLTLVPPEARERSQAELSAVVRRELNSYPGLKAVVMDLSQSGFTAQRGYPLELSVRGRDWGQLVAASQGLMGKLQASGAVVDLDSDYQLGMPELRVLPDRERATDLGVPMDALASTVNAAVGGVRVGSFSSGGRRIDVRLRLLASQRARPEDIGRLKVRTAGSELVPLSTLVTQKEQPALQAITRRERERAVTIYGNVASGHSQGEVLAIAEKLGAEMPEGTRVVLGGASEAFRDSMLGLLFALGLGLLIAYMVLASQFNSFLHPITVMAILPLSVAGAIFTLWLTGMSFNVFSGIGLLLLLGIAKKNSIILVDYANTVRQRDALGAAAAMRAAGPVRLRPILMTSIATLMAAIPSALALGPGAETRAPMAVGIIGGLVVATALSLLVVPAFYVVADRAAGSIRARFGKKPATMEGASE